MRLAVCYLCALVISMGFPPITLDLSVSALLLVWLYVIVLNTLLHDKFCLLAGLCSLGDILNFGIHYTPG